MCKAMPNAPPWSAASTFNYATDVQIITNINLAWCQILQQRKWWLRLALTKSEAAAFLVSWHGIEHIKKAEKLWAKVVPVMDRSRGKVLLALRVC